MTKTDQTRMRAKGGGAPVVRKRDPVRARKQILDSATGLFAAQGPDATPVDQIARRAKLNKRMIYHYFGSKQGLYLAVLEQVYGRIGSMSAGVLARSSSLEQIISGFIDAYFRFLEQNPEFVRLLNWENSRGAEGLKRIDLAGLAEPMLAAVRDRLEKRRAEHDLRDSIDVQYLIVVCLGLCSYYFTNRYTLSVVFDLDLEDSAMKQRWVAMVKRLVLGALSDDASPADPRKAQLDTGRA